MLTQNHCFSNGKTKSQRKTRGVGGTGGLDVAKASYGKTIADY